MGVICAPIDNLEWALGYYMVHYPGICRPLEIKIKKKGNRMELEQVIKRINGIIYEVMDGRITKEEITPDKHLVNDMGIESSEILEIFLTIMSDFSVDMNRNTVMKFTNINDICTYICESNNKKRIELE